MDRHYHNEWGRKGATISDKTARLEYGLTQDEIYDCARPGIELPTIELLDLMPEWSVMLC
jgi:hypothetical protein